MKTLAVLSAIALVTGASQAAVFTFEATMDGPSEFPANASPGTGFGTFIYDDVAHTLSISVSFSGLTGVTTAAHIHAPTVNPGLLTAGVATQTPSFATFPLGVSSGTHNQTVDLTLTSSYSSGFLTANGGTAAGAEAALFSAMTSGRSYYNIHSSTFSGGEIRGFLAAVPEPAETATLLTGLAGAGALAIRRLRAKSGK